MLGLTPLFGQNEWVAITPKIENHNISSWACQTTVDESLTANSDCSAYIDLNNLTTIVNLELFELTLAATASIKLNAAEVYTSELRFPERLDELGIDQRWIDDAYVDHVIVEPKTKSILFGLDDIYGTNEWLMMTVLTNHKDTITWHCKTTLPRSMVNAKDCSVSVKVENLFRLKPLGVGTIKIK